MNGLIPSQGEKDVSDVRWKGAHTGARRFQEKSLGQAVGVWRSWNEEEMGRVGKGCEKLHIKTQALILSLRGQQTFSLKGQIVNTFLFVGRKEVSVKPTQFRPCSPGQPSSYVNRWAWLCSHKTLCTKTEWGRSSKNKEIIKKARKFQKNIYFCFIDYTEAFDCVDHNKLWIILQEMGIPDPLTCPLRNLYAGQEATVRTGHGTTDWFQIGKGVCQGCILSPCLFNLYAEYIMWSAGLDEAQAGTRIAGRNKKPQISRWHHPYSTKRRRTKEPLDESESREWKRWLKTQHSEN